MKYITSQEFKETIITKKACILPTGSYEQHGGHCVLETDSILAEKIAEIVGKMTNIPVLPVISYGISYIHKSFPGTIYITDTTYISYISDIILSLKNNEVRRLFIINGHGANYNSLLKAVNNYSDEGFKIEIFNWFEFIGEDIFPKKHRSHAGSMETSALAFLNKDFIRSDSVENMVLNEKYNYTKIVDIKECTLNGVIGAADEWSVEKGETIIGVAAGEIAERIRYERDCT
ncbi:creatininase family protein [Bacteroides heparinolyticus]|uniref:creatininase family protein n=1 Tax=Prevotella heparinolytica TaxID=28113 RepID=UPI00359FB0A2